MTGVRLLVADDTVMVTRVIERHFQSMGWIVDCVHDGMEALMAARNGDYDIIFLDQFMPTMLGAEVLQTVRQTDTETPIIMISSLDDEGTVVRCLDMGANDFLHKPVDTRELEIRATVHLRRAMADRPPAAG